MMAQIMANIKYPTDDIYINPSSFAIKVDDEVQYESIMGSPYSMDIIASNPEVGTATTLPEAQMIGHLVWDAAISIGSEFNRGGVTVSYPDRVADRLVDTFGYWNAILAYAKDLTWDEIKAAINTNLDAGIPVGLGVSASDYPIVHAVVVDGYGFNGGTIYHHLNMGRDLTVPDLNIWYSLPDFYLYDQLDSIIYNIFAVNEDPSVSGTEIISGRVVSSGDVPTTWPNVQVKLESAGMLPKITRTDNRGIFYFTQLPSSTTFTLSAALAEHAYPRVEVHTRRSTSPTPSRKSTVGNHWNELLIQEGVEEGVGGCGLAVFPAAFLLVCAGIVSASKLRAIRKRR
jgi:hypothetical protein